MKYRPIKTVLSIAGSDSSGGAGIQADIKSITANGCYAMTAITALTAQNTKGVFGISTCESGFLKKQLDCIADDMPVDAVKIGMLSSVSNIKVIEEFLKSNNIKNIVLDPVMVSTSGSKLIDDFAISELTNRLFPLAAIITPNIPEAELLADKKIRDKHDMEECVKLLHSKYGCAVLLKGGHMINDANDVLAVNGNIIWYNSNRIDNENTHGTGCTLSSAIASNLAKGYGIDLSIKKSKQYIENTLKYAINLGHQNGPLNHGYNIDGDGIKSINLYDAVRLYAVTDNRWLKEDNLCNQVEQAIKGGVTFVQLRDKNADYEALLEEALCLRELTRKYDIPFVINDNVDIAVLSCADGVHLGQDDMSVKEARILLGNNKIIGATAHNLDEAIHAIREGADYIGVGAVFGSATKDNTFPLSREELRKICEFSSVPVVAIGGINLDNIELLKGSKISGVAVVSAIFAQNDVKNAALSLNSKLNEVIGQ